MGSAYEGGIPGGVPKFGSSPNAPSAKDLGIKPKEGTPTGTTSVGNKRRVGEALDADKQAAIATLGKVSDAVFNDLADRWAAWMLARFTLQQYQTALKLAEQKKLQAQEWLDAADKDFLDKVYGGDSIREGKSVSVRLTVKAMLAQVPRIEQQISAARLQYGVDFGLLPSSVKNGYWASFRPALFPDPKNPTQVLLVYNFTLSREGDAPLGGWVGMIGNYHGPKWSEAGTKYYRCCKPVTTKAEGVALVEKLSELRANLLAMKPSSGLSVTGLDFLGKNFVELPWMYRVKQTYDYVSVGWVNMIAEIKANIKKYQDMLVPLDADFMPLLLNVASTSLIPHAVVKIWKDNGFAPFVGQYDGKAYNTDADNFKLLWSCRAEAEKRMLGKLAYPQLSKVLASSIGSLGLVDTGKSHLNYITLNAPKVKVLKAQLLGIVETAQASMSQGADVVAAMSAYDAKVAEIKAATAEIEKFVQYVVNNMAELKERMAKDSAVVASFDGIDVGWAESKKIAEIAKNNDEVLAFVKLAGTVLQDALAVIDSQLPQILELKGQITTVTDAPPVTPDGDGDGDGEKEGGGAGILLALVAAAAALAFGGG